MASSLAVFAAPSVASLSFCQRVSPSNRNFAAGPALSAPVARRFAVRAAEPLNPDIQKDNPKVVDTVDPTTIQKQTSYCRCWRSATFPLCNGSHVKWNKETGDNVGPLLVKPAPASS
eukprot:TRINITY_DN18912_c0_g1_i1.p1 TRINITY_DN18912_c0_g1~~TRINITY_DN18912_c0_g1_i1.p1  ORF type:complete len:117 (-),score=11.55 TRINITY_DN18912_c0_g1_i1:150-500(-)